MDEAIGYFKKAIAINEKNPRFRNNLALAYGEKGEFELALSELKISNDEAKAYYYMAQIYFKKNRFVEAKDHYTKALKLNPSLTIAQTSLDASIALEKIFGQATSQETSKPFVLPEPSIMVVEKKEFPRVESLTIKEVEIPISQNLTKEGAKNC